MEEGGGGGQRRELCSQLEVFVHYLIHDEGS